MGMGGYQTYQYFILLFFTLSVEGRRGKVNDAIFTLSAFFWMPSLRDAFQKKKSVWRDIVPIRGGGGKNKLQNIPT